MSISVTPAWQGSPRIQATTKAYCVYGHASAAPVHLLAFKAEYFDTAIDSYMLGQGYRSYSPTLMRFRSVDSCSPFGRGGIHAYAYCTGDPVNRTDPDGHADMTGMSVKKVKFQPVPSRGGRGGQMIRALANQVLRTAHAVPRAADATNMTPHEQVRSFNQRATEILQQARPVVTQQQQATHQVNLTIQARTGPIARLRAELDRLTIQEQPHTQIESSTPRVSRIRQAQDHRSDNPRQP
ncbi:TPA: RHS repeat-associated core domain-containing protein [Pseudomonas putida]|nr:RHS repeat-associated core domain-containing protein [Pseudomonas putida]